MAHLHCIFNLEDPVAGCSSALSIETPTKSYQEPGTRERLLQVLTMKSTSTLLPYHEKQSHWNQLCLVHALNMLFGSKQVDQATLNVICERLAPDSSSWWNPHRSALGLGNYDANVALTVFQEHGLEATFCDNRKPVDELLARLGALEGLLVNVPGSMFLPGSRHWIAYRPTATVKASPPASWWILDSKQAGPIQVDSMEQALADHLARGDYIIMVQKQA
jgi:hypothetical protein